MTSRALSAETSIAILGGGITGLTTAFYLSRAGYKVTVLEAQKDVGGLASAFNYGPFTWDKFYHCILTSDKSLLALLEDIGLSSSLRWNKTEVGFYSHDKLYRMTAPADLLKFPHLSMTDKFRFAAGTLFAARLARSEGLESVPLKAWTVRIFGKTLYQEIWEPLLRCKLGDLRKDASAAFLHATLKRLYSTREKGPDKQEKLGFIHGGYRLVLQRLCEQIESQHGVIRRGIRVKQVSIIDNAVSVESDDGTELFDRVVLTTPNRIVKSICPSLPPDYVARLDRVQYLGMVCAVLILRRPLSEFYVTNITEASPFTGVIEMTNLIGTSTTNGYSLVYLPKYTPASDPLFTSTDQQVLDTFRHHLMRMHPTLRSFDIVREFVFREASVQPLPSLHYSDLALPAMKTPLPGIFLANTSQIVNDTLNNNAMAAIAREVSRQVCQSIESEATQNRKRHTMSPLRTEECLAPASPVSA